MMISYLFPPTAGSGVQRSAKFVKYLPRFGWRPVVVAARGRYLTRAYGVDPTLAEGLGGARVWRLGEWDLRPIFEAARRLAGPEPEVGATDRVGRQCRRAWRALFDLAEKGLRVRQFNPWVLNAFALGRRLIRKHGIRVIYSSHPPIYAHVAAWLLSRATGLPWVADYRDPYTTEVGWAQGPCWYARYLRRLEARLVRQAKTVVSVGKGWTEDMRSGFPDEPPEKFRTIRNGYDEKDFNVQPIRGTGEVTIVHAGLFYWGHRDPTVFLRAVAKWAGPDGVLPGVGRLGLDFLGPEDVTLRSRVGELGLQRIVHMPGRVAHAECVARLLGADLVLVVNGPSDDPHALTTLTGKLYEALGSMRPVLALTGEKSEMAELCREVGGCWVADVNDEEGIIRCLQAWACCVSKARLPERSRQAVAQLTREAQAKHLADVFDLAVGGRGEC